MFSRGGRFESFIRLGGHIYNAVYQRLFWRRPVGRNLGVSVPLGFKRRNHPHSSRLIDQRRGVSSTRVRTTCEYTSSSPIPTEKKKKVSMKKVVEKPVSINVRTHEATLRPKALEIAKRLNALYPNPPIPLHHGSGFQLLCAVVLSAQTTDIKVNEVTPALFAIGPDAESMSKCDVKDIQNIIATLGLAPTKAKNLKALSIQLMEEHDGIVPQTYEELEALPGVGHKTASVVMSQVHGEPAFPVDTHIHRLAQRWGLTDGSSVEQTEADLKYLFPKESWNSLHLQIIYFGREMCPARSHDPNTCPICSWAAVHPYNKVSSSNATNSGGRKRTQQKQKEQNNSKKKKN